MQRAIYPVFPAVRSRLKYEEDDVVVPSIDELRRSAKRQKRAGANTASGRHAQDPEDLMSFVDDNNNNEGASQAPERSPAANRPSKDLIKAILEGMEEECLEAKENLNQVRVQRDEATAIFRDVILEHFRLANCQEWSAARVQAYCDAQSQVKSEIAEDPWWNDEDAVIMEGLDRVMSRVDEVSEKMIAVDKAFNEARDAMKQSYEEVQAAREKKYTLDIRIRLWKSRLKRLRSHAEQATPQPNNDCGQM